MYIAWDDCEVAANGRSSEDGVSVRLAALSRIVVARLRADCNGPGRDGSARCAPERPATHMTIDI